MIARVIYKLPIGNREVTNRDNDFKGQAYEIENATSRHKFMAPSSLEALSRKSSKLVSLLDIRRYSKRVPNI